MADRNFADTLFQRACLKQSQLVVGLDPRFERLPQGLRPRGVAPTAADAARAIEAFNRAVVDAVFSHAVAVKCQVAFYEEFGCAGMQAYAATIRYARDKGLLVIGDVKRNDIASTASAYAAAHLGHGDGSPPWAEDFIVDAVTVNPYVGSDGMRPFLEAAAANGRGVFALVKTSNPSSVEVQDLDSGGAPLYERVAALVEQWGRAYCGECGYSLLGAVVGATFPADLVRLRGLMPGAPFLIPGLGAQGGRVEDVAGAFDSRGLGAVVSSSRDVIFAWERSPYREEFGQARWQDAVAAAAADMQRALWRATH
jgi:orotidine-5'-phosphate decarboxylase